jgi:hypothetical protein
MFEVFFGTSKQIPEDHLKIMKLVFFHTHSISLFIAQKSDAMYYELLIASKNELQINNNLAQPKPTEPFPNLCPLII